LALGGGIDGGIVLFKHDNVHFAFHCQGNYKYLLESTEKRLPCIKNIKSIVPVSLKTKERDKIPYLKDDFAHYFLGVRKVELRGKSGVFPIANALAQDFRVKPGSQFNALCHFSFVNKKVGINGGYNFFWQEQESVWIKNFNFESVFIINDNLNISESLNPGSVNNDIVNTTKIITSSNIDLNSIKAPTKTCHKFYGSFSYEARLYKRYVLDLSCGMSYELSDDNAIHTNYGVWLKATTSF
jgi:hypothetical protein